MRDVGVGSGTAKIGDTTATVMLDTADFVVNTDYAMDQFLAEDFEANGLQLAATTDGHWTARSATRATRARARSSAARSIRTACPRTTVAAGGHERVRVLARR